MSIFLCIFEWITKRGRPGVWAVTVALVQSPLLTPHTLMELWQQLVPSCSTGMQLLLLTFSHFYQPPANCISAIKWPAGAVAEGRCWLRNDPVTYPWLINTVHVLGCTGPLRAAHRQLCTAFEYVSFGSKLVLLSVFPFSCPCALYV